jgi:HEAT repeat protein
MYLLAKVGGDKAVETLLSELESQDAVRSNNAAFALGRMRIPRIVEPLIRALGRGNIGAALSLGSLGDPRAVPPLIKSLEGHTTGVSRKLRAVPALFDASWLGRRDIRHFAAGALGELGDPRAVESLKRIVLTNDSWVSRAAKEALKKIQARQTDTPSTKPRDPTPASSPR